MIRRDVRLADGRAGWMLIPQPEHARASAELAAQCRGRFERSGSSSPPPDLRDEVLAAIAHHDDGWTAWEQAPRLDPTLHHPLAFTEISPNEAIAIWTGSIDAAAVIGPLAASMVAGHFLRLAQKSGGGDAPPDDPVAAWIKQTDQLRSARIDEWLAADAAHRTRDAADEALQWLWTFDELSLWLCCTCSPEDRAIPCAPAPYHAGRGTPVEMELVAAEPGLATVRPWQFESRHIDVAIAGQVVPAMPFSSSAEMLALAQQHILRWRLTPRENPGETSTKPRS
jgi:hypothetical protein